MKNDIPTPKRPTYYVKPLAERIEEVVIFKRTATFVVRNVSVHFL